MAKCQGCGAEIRWLENIDSGRKAPVDPEPVDRGNVRIVRMAKGEAFVVIPPSRIEAAALAGTVLHQLHFATCPQAERFKRCGRCHHTPCQCQGALFV